MHRFYKNVQADVNKNRLFYVCPICKQKYHSALLPFYFKGTTDQKRDDHGRNIAAQLADNKCTAFAVRRFSLRFNRCTVCGEWVCDKCFLSKEENDICKNCKSGPRERTED